MSGTILLLLVVALMMGSGGQSGGRINTKPITPRPPPPRWQGEK